ncbi:hypothetical protein GCM10023223_51960 [Stackebrandtia albiflava]
MGLGVVLIVVGVAAVMRELPPLRHAVLKLAQRQAAADRVRVKVEALRQDVEALQAKLPAKPE